MQNFISATAYFQYFPDKTKSPSRGWDQKGSRSAHRKATKKRQKERQENTTTSKDWLKVSESENSEKKLFVDWEKTHLIFEFERGLKVTEF